MNMETTMPSSEEVRQVRCNMLLQYARSQPRGLAVSAMAASPLPENHGNWSRTTTVGLLFPSAGGLLQE